MLRARWKCTTVPSINPDTSISSTRQICISSNLLRFPFPKKNIYILPTLVVKFCQKPTIRFNFSICDSIIQNAALPFCLQILSTTTTTKPYPKQIGVG
jgi:hypothetical protein